MIRRTMTWIAVGLVLAMALAGLLAALVATADNRYYHHRPRVPTEPVATPTAPPGA